MRTSLDSVSFVVECRSVGVVCNRVDTLCEARYGRPLVDPFYWDPRMAYIGVAAQCPIRGDTR